MLTESDRVLLAVPLSIATQAQGDEGQDEEVGMDGTHKGKAIRNKDRGERATIQNAIVQVER